MSAAPDPAVTDPAVTDPAVTDPDGDLFSGIAFCPVCVSNLDLEAHDGERVTLECTSCGQNVTFTVDATRFHTYSIH